MARGSSRNIPQEMKDARRWIIHDDRKRPKNPRTGQGNDWQLERNWVTFREAVHACNCYGLPGVGFVTGGGWVGVDLDHAIRERGIAPRALEIIEQLDSYAEISPSGDGFHIFVKVDPGTAEFNLNGKAAALYPGAQIDISDVTGSAEGGESHVEMYHGGHYLTVTGDAFGNHLELREDTAAVLKLREKCFTPAKPAEAPTPKQPARPTSAPIDPRAENYVNQAGDIDWQKLRADEDGDEGTLNDALNAIDPAMLDDKEWWTICAAALTAGIPYDVIDQWCAQDAVRYNPRENYKRITSATGNRHGADAGRGTVLKMASSRFGWSSRWNDLKSHVIELGRERRRSSSVRRDFAPANDYALDWDGEIGAEEPPAGNDGYYPQSTAEWPQEAAGGDLTQGEGESTPEPENAATRLQGAAPAIYNVDRFESDAEIIYICTASGDADAIEDAGGAAVAIADDINILRDYFKDHGEPRAILTACLRDGKKSRTLYDHLKKTGGVEAAEVPAAKLTGKHPTIADAGAHDPAGLRAALEREAAGIKQPDGLEYYFTAGGMMEDLRNFHQVAKFGFPNLDRQTGGMYCGNLVSIGAATSIGKSSLCIQIADNIATAGGHVIYYSLEMSKLEMVSKCQSRRLYQSGASKAFTSLEIRKGAASPDLMRVTEQFQKDVGGRLSIIGDDRLTVEKIIRTTESYIRRNHAAPIVIVDYLQLIRPAKDSAYKDDRRRLDETIQDLKHLAMDYGTAVILVSGFNRTNNLAPVTHESFAETSGIEKTSDIVAGLELAVMESDTFKDDDEKKKIKKRDLVKEAAKQRPRRMILSVLKNRQAVMNGQYKFLYDTEHDYFREVEYFDNDDDSMNISGFTNSAPESVQKPPTPPATVLGGRVVLK